MSHRNPRNRQSPKVELAGRSPQAHEQRAHKSAQKSHDLREQLANSNRGLKKQKDDNSSKPVVVELASPKSAPKPTQKPTQKPAAAAKPAVSKPSQSQVSFLRDREVEEPKVEARRGPLTFSSSEPQAKPKVPTQLQNVKITIENELAQSHLRSRPVRPSGFDYVEEDNRVDGRTFYGRMRADREEEMQRVSYIRPMLAPRPHFQESEVRGGPLFQRSIQGAIAPATRSSRMDTSYPEYEQDYVYDSPRSYTRTIQIEQPRGAIRKF